MLALFGDCCRAALGETHLRNPFIEHGFVDRVRDRAPSAPRMAERRSLFVRCRPYGSFSEVSALYGFSVSSAAFWAATRASFGCFLPLRTSITSSSRFLRTGTVL